MPEIKNQFTGGKMNKDLDERLVPKGEYRDAMNIQVSTSEGSDVGTVQNILGNSLNEQLAALSLNSNAKCVGSISDEKNDAFYWLVNESNLPSCDVSQGRDIILESKNGVIKYVFVDIKDVHIPLFSLQAPASGNLVVNDINGFNAISVGDKFTIAMPGWDGDEQYTVLSKDGSDPNQLLINIGDYTNATWAYYQTQGPCEIQITLVKGGGVLKFPQNKITGINIVDDMLFWTDGITEPKKINIPRSIEGTNPDGTQHTLLINPEQNITVGSNIKTKEEHITVIRKAPKSVLSVETETTSVLAEGTTINPLFPQVPQSWAPPNSSSNFQPGDEFEIVIFPDYNINSSLEIGDNLLFNSTAQAQSPNDIYDVSIILLEQTNDGSSDIVVNQPPLPAFTLYGEGTFEVWKVRLENNIDNVTAGDYDWEVKRDSSSVFKNLFPRFSYRYKYTDGEYSTFAPFTKVIFEPGDFKYNVTEAYNLGMDNNLTKVTLFNYNADLPEDVESIDLLYKESNSPIIYTIETLKGYHINSGRDFEVTKNQVKAAVPENQTLRAWDNVPRSALAQDVTGSRIVYGNYLQNYTNTKQPIIEARLTLRDYCDQTMIGRNFEGFPSIKSIRNYTLGVSYLDKYGRQSPVFTNKSASVDVPISSSDHYNQISTRLLSDVPEWASYYKIYIKETSNEYYNLAMDRIYDARDGNIWLSFPSSDRNKIDEETFLILKKGVEGAEPVNDKNRYKILAIENQAPEYIKTKNYRLGKVQEPNATDFTSAPAGATIFINTAGYPIEGNGKIIIDSDQFDLIGLPLITDNGERDFKDLSVRFSTIVNGSEQKTQYYDVSTYTIDTSVPAYTLILEKPIEETWLETSIGSNIPSNNNLGITIYRKEVKNDAKFDGRFFVKIARNAIVNENIIEQAAASMIVSHRATTQIPFYHVSDGSDPNSAENISAITGVSSPSSYPLGFGDLDNIFGSNGIGSSGWFIDNMHYEGFYAPGTDQDYLRDTGLWWCEMSGNIQQQQQVTSTQSQAVVPNSRTSGYNKGIYTDGSGQTWMHLSFGGVESEIGSIGSSWQTSSRQLHTSAGIGDTQFDDGKECSPHGELIHDVTAGLDGCQGNHGRQAFWEGIFDWQGNKNMLNLWKLGSSVNDVHLDEQDAHIAIMTPGSKFKFHGDIGNTIYKITDTPEIYYHLTYFDTQSMQDKFDDAISNAPNYPASGWASLATQVIFDWMEQLGHSRNRRITYRIPIASVNPTRPDNPTDANSSFNPLGSSTNKADANSSGRIVFVEEQWEEYSDNQIISEDPAVWETEPKEDIGLNIYHELDSTFPVEINNDTNYTFAPVGTQVTHGSAWLIPTTTTVVGWQDNILELSETLSDLNWGGNPNNTLITFHRPDGSCVTSKFKGLYNPTDQQGVNFSNKIIIDPDVSKANVNLSWFNCYSFGNGVESNRVRDDFNQVVIDKGPKVSSTLDEPYEEEHRKYGLIHSGLYNSTSSVNNLNQFIQAEKITKDVNPTYGSIQKLHTRDTDLIVLCEDKVLKILSNKDAVFNADGNAQLTATNNVLGQTMPFIGEYGISKNPESFASESYRAYFTDKTRGSVIRLSKDGLTPVSNHGMKDWFKDNLKLNDNLLGSYDDKKDEYNITLNQTTEQVPKTVTFKEDVTGWVSFKSFVPEDAISCANEYYTFKDGKPWKHHDENAARNTFYNLFNSTHYSTINVILNDSPEIVKSFDTLSYEGSQSKVDQLTTDPVTGLGDGEYYNLQSKNGWHVEYIKTNKQRGTVNEFIEKEGKWFNYIRGEDIATWNDNSGASPLQRLQIDSDGNSNWE